MVLEGMNALSHKIEFRIFNVRGHRKTTNFAYHFASMAVYPVLEKLYF